MMKTVTGWLVVECDDCHVDSQPGATAADAEAAAIAAGFKKTTVSGQAMYFCAASASRVRTELT